HVKCLYSTAMVRAGNAMGTGNVIYSKKIGNDYFHILLSCAHVCHENNDIKILTVNYKNWSTVDTYDTHDARLYYIDYEKDIALILFSSDQPLHKSKISFEDLYIGNKVYSFGFGDRLPIPRLDQGEIT